MELCSFRDRCDSSPSTLLLTSSVLTMSHPIRSHHLEQGLLKKFFSIDIAKVATRTSSVRLTRQPRLFKSKLKRSHTQSGGHAIPDIRPSDLKDVDESISHPRRPSGHGSQKPSASALPLPVLEAQDLVMYPTTDYSDEKTRSRYGHGAERKRTSVRTPTPADGTSRPTQLEKHDITCNVVTGRSTGAALTSNRGYFAQDTLARTTDEQAGGEPVTSAVELGWAGWKFVRAALQVNAEPVADDCPMPPMLHDHHGAWRAWKHADSNFFPCGTQHLEQDDVIRTVLEGLDRSG